MRAGFSVHSGLHDCGGVRLGRVAGRLARGGRLRDCLRRNPIRGLEFVGPELTDVLASMAAMGALFVLIKVWKPRDKFDFGHLPPAKVSHSARNVALAWAPYMILVVLVLLWGYPPFKAKLDAVSMPIQWPGLHNMVQQMPPVVAQPSRYGAVFNFQWLSASGTACLFTAILVALVVGLSPLQFFRVFEKRSDNSCWPS